MRRDRGLWQFFLAIFVLSFSIQRVQVAVVAYLSEASDLRIIAYGIQAALGLVTALGIWLGRLWVLGVLIAWGLGVAATVLLETLLLEVRPPISALAELIFVAVLTVGLFLLLRYEFGEPVDSGEESREEPRDS